MLGCLPPMNWWFGFHNHPQFVPPAPVVVQPWFDVRWKDLATSENSKKTWQYGKSQRFYESLRWFCVIRLLKLIGLEPSKKICVNLLPYSCTSLNMCKSQCLLPDFLCSLQPLSILWVHSTPICKLNYRCLMFSIPILLSYVVNSPVFVGKWGTSPNLAKPGDANGRRSRALSERRESGETWSWWVSLVSLVISGGFHSHGIYGRHCGLMMVSDDEWWLINSDY